MDEQRVRAAIDDMACAMLRWVDPSEYYLVINQNRAAPFITQRLTAGLPVNMVGHRDSQSGNPIRDLAIYHVTPLGEGHNEIAEGWVQYLVEHEIAVLKEGNQVTVEDLKACATMTAIAFLESEQEHDT